MRRCFFFICSLFLSCSVFSTTIDVESLRAIGIPLLVIETDNGVTPPGYPVYPPNGAWGVGLAGNDYCTGEISMYLGDSLLYGSGKYDSEAATGMRIRLRGNTSAHDVKQPYKIKLSKKADLLLRGVSGYEDKEWVLIDSWQDNIVKTVMGFKLGELLGLGWHPACRYVNVVLNGDYKGVYILCETVKRSSARCNISKTGYLIEDDAYWWNEDVYFKGEILPFPVGYTFKYPDSDDVDDTTISNIRNYIIDFERALKSGEGFEEYIDVESFAAWLLAHDILGTSDSGGANRFLYKHDFDAKSPTSTKLKMGILWDFNTSFRANGWSSIHGKSYSFYYSYLLNDHNFNKLYVNLWNKVKGTLYNEISTLLDDIAMREGEALNESFLLEFARWGYTTDDTDVCHANYKQLLGERIDWITQNITSMSTRVDDIVDSSETVDVYDLQGRLVGVKMSIDEIDSLTKGIYLVGGKKYLVQ